MEAINLENVWVHFNHVPILEDITLSVQENDFLSIIGPNGGGKTTLLKVILGLVRPKKGTVKVFGTSPDIGRKKIGYLPQYISFDTHFPISVFDVVLMGRYTQPFKPYSEEDKEKAFTALKTVDMTDFSKRQVGSLSGGELQRVFLARALAREPALLLLDEPTSSIDPEMRKSFYDLLLVLKGKMTIILVTHDISVVSSYVNSIACLDHSLFYCGSVKEGLKKLEDIYKCPVEILAHKNQREKND